MFTIEEKKRNDYATLVAKAEERKRPAREKEAKVQHGYNRWFQGELARGANVSTTPPTEVDAAIAAARRSGREAARQFFEGHRANLMAELEEDIAAADTALKAALAASERLRQTETNFNRLAAVCDAPHVRVSIPDDTISGTGFQDWRARVRTVLHPPAPQPRRRAEENPLRLD